MHFVKHWRDYYALCKPRVVALMLFTAVVGMELATPQSVPFDLILWTLLGIALVAGSSAAMNHIFEQSLDIKMHRTQGRPLPTGRLTSRQALIFSMVIGIAGFLILAFGANLLTAFLTLASWLGYAWVYTKGLKPNTPQNIVIGGLAGAAPPLLGWTAVTASIDPGALLLVLIIFAWTPPHFWALALYRRKDYEAAGLPMLPVTHGEAFTKLHIILYTLLLVACTLLVFATGLSGKLYLAVAVVLNSIFLYYVLALKWNGSEKLAFRTFLYSIVYLGLLFLGLWVDHIL